MRHVNAIPEPQRQLLHAIEAEWRARSSRGSDRGASSEHTGAPGVFVLFVGPSGSGKTMAAELLASRLHLGLYRVDLSAVTSKWAGQTEKNLARVFADADRPNTMLFFDEADAVFGKRTEVKDSHDRYANIEVAYVLELMEAFHGLAILATNAREDIDDAFLGRIRHVVPFTRPVDGAR